VKGISKRLKAALESVSSSFVMFQDPATIIESWEETSFTKEDEEDAVQNKSIEIQNTAEIPENQEENKHTYTEVPTLQKASYRAQKENAFTHLQDSEIELREYTSLTTIGALDSLTPNGTDFLVRIGMRDISVKERQQRYFSPESPYRKRPPKEYQASRVK
jgi:hypothetical protein